MKNLSGFPCFRNYRFPEIGIDGGASNAEIVLGWICAAHWILLLVQSALEGPPRTSSFPKQDIHKLCFEFVLYFSSSPTCSDYSLKPWSNSFRSTAWKSRNLSHRMIACHIYIRHLGMSTFLAAWLGMSTSVVVYLSKSKLPRLSAAWTY